MSNDIKMPDEIKLKIEEKYPVYNWMDSRSANQNLKNQQVASFGYSLAAEQLLQKDKTIEGLKEKVNDLTMADMTHEYNEAEGERFRPEYERQLTEPLNEEIKKLRRGLAKISYGYDPDCSRPGVHIGYSGAKEIADQLLSSLESKPESK